MRWLDLARHRPLPHPTPGEPEESADTPVVRASPGVAKLFDSLSQDGRHSVLDLGPAADRHLRLFNPRRPYDVVLAWDILDRLDPCERGALIERLTDVTAPRARLYAVVRSSGGATTRPFRSTLIHLDRVSQQVVGPVVDPVGGPPEPAGDVLLPAHVERILAPFEVAHAFILTTGLREYVAVKR